MLLRGIGSPSLTADDCLLAALVFTNLCVCVCVCEGVGGQGLSVITASSCGPCELCAAKQGAG